jgi:hypothetical protein
VGTGQNENLFPRFFCRYFQAFIGDISILKEGEKIGRSQSNSYSKRKYGR